MSARQQVLDRVRSVSAMPSAVAELAAILQEPEVNISRVTQAIEHDPGLTSNVLRLANSAYFGTPRTVGTIREAIVRLGTNRIFQLAVVAGVAPIAQRRVKGYDLPPGALWEHSVAVAVGATELSTSLGLAAPNYIFTAGLLHDVGKIVLGTFVEVDPAPILGLAFDQGLSFEEAEREVLGIDHAEVGAALLEHWGLPGPIAEVVRCHHHPAKVHGDPLVADLVHVADVLALMAGLGTGSDGLHYRPAAESLERLDVTNLVAEAATCRMLGRLEELRGLFANALRG